MEVLLPYLLLMGCGSIGAILIALFWKQINIGIIGNALTGMAGGFCCSYLMKYIFLIFPTGSITYGVMGLIAGIGSMCAIGLLRRKTNQSI